MVRSHRPDILLGPVHLGRRMDLYENFSLAKLGGRSCFRNTLGIALMYTECRATRRGRLIRFWRSVGVLLDEVIGCGGHESTPLAAQSCIKPVILLWVWDTGTIVSSEGHTCWAYPRAEGVLGSDGQRCHQTSFEYG